METLFFKFGVLNSMFCIPFFKFIFLNSWLLQRCFKNNLFVSNFIWYFYFRFFDSLRSQKGIVVQLISRESGEEITQEVEDKNIKPGERSSESVLAKSTNDNIDDNNCNDTSTVLSDVELYKIYFRKNVI